MTPRRGGQRNSRLFALLGLIALVGIGALGYAATQRNAAPAAATRAVDPALAAQAEGYLLGSPDAPVKILEFADFECPGCAQFATVTEPDVRKRLVETGQASFRFYDYPLDQHQNSYPASHAAACAAEQGKFWEMHDRIFAGQNDWSTYATSSPKKIFQGYAGTIGLDVGKWEQCYDAERYLKKIQANRAEGDRRQIPGTPTLYVNDRQANVAGYDQLKALVDSARTDVVVRGGAAAPKADSAAAAPR